MDKASRCQPDCDSTKSSPGRLIQISVTSGRDNHGASGRRVIASEVCASGAASLVKATTLLLRKAELIDPPEVNISRRYDLDAIALVHEYGGWDTDGLAEHFSEHAAGRRGLND